MTKNELREWGLAQRNSLSPNQVCDYSKAICSRLYDLLDIEKDPWFVCYSSFQNEVATQEIIEKQLEHLGVIILPKVRGVELILHKVTKLEDLVPNQWGILEPNDQSILMNREYDNIKCVLVPGVVFDRCGNRIGFGRGYYDRLFDALPNVLKVALAYSVQIADSIPAETHDVAMDSIVTEEGLIKF